MLSNILLSDLVPFLYLNMQMIQSERLQVKELRNQGHMDRQLQEMGYLEVSLHSPSVASLGGQSK